MSSHDHAEEGFIRKYIFSTDHKVIGIQYAITALVFLFIGFLFMMFMRWQLAYPNTPVPYVGGLLTFLFGENFAPGGVISSDLYNQFGAMHGTTMIFLGVVPLGAGALGNYLVPLQIGAQDMAFPKLNMLSYWTYLLAGLVIYSPFFLGPIWPEYFSTGMAHSGWTSYPPLSTVGSAGGGQTMWLLGMFVLINSSLLASINIIVTVFQLRAKGLRWMRLPFHVWTQLCTAFILLLAFPPLQGASIMQLMDRLFGTSFFAPTGLATAEGLAAVSGGGSPILWQHLFWFLAHPEVYVLILPAIGAVSEIIATNTRRPLWGYKPLVYSVVFLSFMSFLVWAHHMFLTGMGTVMNSFFSVTTMIISIPSVIIISAMAISLWGASIRFNTPMLFALAFLPMFGIGGLTGLPLGLASADIHLHDTYYVIGHFHYVVAPGVLFGLFASIYFWFPKATGRKMNEGLGYFHFWTSLVGMNVVFFPMLIQGMAGVSRRLWDGGASYQHAQDVLFWNEVMTYGAVILLIGQIPFIYNFFASIWLGKEAKDNEWESNTLEWSAAPSPPLPHQNFETIPEVHRGPYDYSLPGLSKDFTPQNEA